MKYVGGFYMEAHEPTTDYMKLNNKGEWSWNRSMIIALDQEVNVGADIISDHMYSTLKLLIPEEML